MQGHFGLEKSICHELLSDEASFEKKNQHVTICGLWEFLWNMLNPLKMQILDHLQPRTSGPRPRVSPRPLDPPRGAAAARSAKRSPPVRKFHETKGTYTRWFSFLMVLAPSLLFG